MPLLASGIMLVYSASLMAQESFNELFFDQSLRIDYMHSGTDTSDMYALDEVLIEPHWGGSKMNLLDTMQYGDYFFKVFREDDDLLIYSRGYSTLFSEWQTTDEAKTVNRSFSESIVFPRPRTNCNIRLYSRDNKGLWEERFTYKYDTSNYFIHPRQRNIFPVFDAMTSGATDKSVDIIILPEGYTTNDMGTFISDCYKFAHFLFSFEPYKSYRNKFNIRGVLAPSVDAGSDIPADSIWKNTILNTSFYTFNSERYCMTYDNKTVRDLAGNAPYDQIYILVNSDKYGGGAIYNYYSVSVNSNLKAAKIFVHELGHGFAGLGDEYYNSEVAYSDFYPTDIEPWEPNLTTLVDFNHKWKDLLEKRTPIPTPATKKWLNKTGVFEGGGYAAKGVYRPAQDCLMNTFKGNKFCEVCQKAIKNMILFYSE